MRPHRADQRRPDRGRGHAGRADDDGRPGLRQGADPGERVAEVDRGVDDTQDPAVFTARAKDSWHWRMLVSQPDWITEEAIDTETLGNIRGCASEAAKMLGLDEAEATPAELVGLHHPTNLAEGYDTQPEPRSYPNARRTASSASESDSPSERAGE